MGFSRASAPVLAEAPDELTAALVGIGMNFAATGAPCPNIEDTLLFASAAAMDQDDLRLLSILVTWFGVHHAWVNADRLIHLVSAQDSPRIRALWCALAMWKSKDRRFARLAKLHVDERIDLLAIGTEFQIARHGEDPRFADTCLRVPANVLRDRQADVLSPQELSRRHSVYKHRVMIGPTYRADLWATLAGDPQLSASELARRTYASFASAWQVKRDFEVVSAVSE